MINSILVVTAFVVWFGAILGCIVYASDVESIPVAILAIVIFILGMAFVMKMTTEEEKNHPCLKTETSMVYNPATKTVMPMQYCVERGTWVTK
jgi:membrane protein implicated in regulation of membrane protease activity